VRASRTGSPVVANVKRWSRKVQRPSPRSAPHGFAAVNRRVYGAMVDNPLQGFADRATDSGAFEYLARAGFAVRHPGVEARQILRTCDRQLRDRVFRRTLRDGKRSPKQSAERRAERTHDAVRPSAVTTSTRALRRSSSRVTLRSARSYSSSPLLASRRSARTASSAVATAGCRAYIPAGDCDSAWYSAAICIGWIAAPQPRCMSISGAAMPRSS
jgi:hypothetical protein